MMCERDGMFENNMFYLHFQQQGSFGYIQFLDIFVV